MSMWRTCPRSYHDDCPTALGVVGQAFANEAVTQRIRSAALAQICRAVHGRYPQRTSGPLWVQVRTPTARQWCGHRAALPAPSAPSTIGWAPENPERCRGDVPAAVGSATARVGSKSNTASGRQHTHEARSRRERFVKNVTGIQTPSHDAVCLPPRGADTFSALRLPALPAAPGRAVLAAGGHAVCGAAGRAPGAAPGATPSPPAAAGTAGRGVAGRRRGGARRPRGAGARPPRRRPGTGPGSRSRTRSSASRPSTQTAARSPARPRSP